MPEKKAYVVERFGKYVKTLTPGIHLLIPFVDRIRSRKRLFRHLIRPAITRDNVSISTDGFLYVKV